MNWEQEVSQLQCDVEESERELQKVSSENKNVRHVKLNCLSLDNAQCPISV